MPRQNLLANFNAPSVWDLEAHQAIVNQQIAQENMAAVLPGGGAGGAGAAPVVQEIWKTNPYSGDFNPGTKLGQTIFAEKLKGLAEEKHLDLTKGNAAELRKYFVSRETTMGDCV